MCMESESSNMVSHQVYKKARSLSLCWNASTKQPESIKRVPNCKNLKTGIENKTYVVAVFVESAWHINGSFCFNWLRSGIYTDSQ